MQIKNHFKQEKNSIFHQPSAFYLIFSIELWERFSFYGLQAIITVYMIRNFGMSELESITLFSSFYSLAYGLTIIGGWLGDKILGTKRSIILGSSLLMISYILLTCSKSNINMVYLSLSGIAVGSGVFKANPSSLLSTCYNKTDYRLDGAFTMFYMSINVGSLISMILTPIIASKYGWNVAFLLSVFGLLITISSFLYFGKLIKNNGSKPDFYPIDTKKIIITVIMMLLLIIIVDFLLHNQKIIRFTLVITTLMVMLAAIRIISNLSKNERKKILGIILLMIEATVFYVLYMQMPTSINFFAIHNVKNSILGLKFEPEQFQALNPFWIIIISPIVAKIYNITGNCLNIPQKFAIGMSLCTIAFFIISIGIHFSNDTGTVSIIWLIISYALQSAGELMISGLGLSMIAKLVSKKLIGVIMGVWFLTTSYAVLIAGNIANLMAIPKDTVNPITSLKVYKHIFLNISIITAVITLVMIFISSFLNKMISEKK